MCSSGVPTCKRGECIADANIPSGLELLNSLVVTDDAELSDDNADAPGLEESDGEEDDPIPSSYDPLARIRKERLQREINAVVDLGPDDDDDETDYQEQLVKELRRIAPKAMVAGMQLPRDGVA